MRIPLPMRVVAGCLLSVFLGVVAVAQVDERQDDERQFDQKQESSIESQTRIHRLASNKRSVFDAFVYINRIPDSPEEGETPIDLAGRIFGRLANQEGRILLKLPPGMDKSAYKSFKTFFQYEGAAGVGNCAACHTLPEFHNAKSHIVDVAGKPKLTPTLRNLKTKKTELRKVILNKVALAAKKRHGDAKDIDTEYAKINLDPEEVDGLVAFLGLLQDVPDEKFRELILNSTLLDTSEEIE